MGQRRTTSIETGVLALGTALALAAAGAPIAAQATVPAPRRSPATADFPTGPALGERLPDFTLSNQHGQSISLHSDRDGHKAAVLFQRSAVW